MRTLLLLTLAALVGLAAPSMATLIIPDDGDSGTDAPNDCSPNGSPVVLQNAVRAWGDLASLADRSDFWKYSAVAGKKVRIFLDRDTGVAPAIGNYDLRIHKADCSGLLAESTNPGAASEEVEFEMPLDGFVNVQVVEAGAEAPSLAPPWAPQPEHYHCTLMCGTQYALNSTQP